MGADNEYPVKRVSKEKEPPTKDRWLTNDEEKKLLSYSPDCLKEIQSQLSDLQAQIESSGTREPIRQLDEDFQKLRAHQHDREGGKAYILEKKGL
jgi:hypothetical protein